MNQNNLSKEQKIEELRNKLEKSDNYRQYKELVDSIHNCNICKNIKVLTTDSNGEFLTNKQAEKRDMLHANLWNYWQGSLNAKVMMIGQDYGCFPPDDATLNKKSIRDYSYEDCLSRNTWLKIKDSENIPAEKLVGKTDGNIFELFRDKNGFNLNIAEPQEDLYFTNIACCYRQKHISGNSTFRPEWCTICAHKFMGNLIDIIKPKIIITLGKSVFSALSCVQGYTLECDSQKKEYLSQSENKKTSKTFSKHADALSHIFTLEKADKKIQVFPVYHPGSYSNKNRPLDKQMEDWRKIANAYKAIKEKEKCRTS